MNLRDILREGLPDNRGCAEEERQRLLEEARSSMSRPEAGPGAPSDRELLDLIFGNYGTREEQKGSDPLFTFPDPLFTFRGVFARFRKADKFLAKYEKSSLGLAALRNRLAGRGRPIYPIVRPLVRMRPKRGRIWQRSSVAEAES